MDRKPIDPSNDFGSIGSIQHILIDPIDPKSYRKEGLLPLELPAEP